MMIILTVISTMLNNVQTLIDCDSIINEEGNCARNYNPGQEDSDSDNRGNLCHNRPHGAHADQEEVGDVCDNCPHNYNPHQQDLFPPQGNGIGDTCDCKVDCNCDGNVEANDIIPFLADFGRIHFNDPGTNDNPCNGDIDCSASVKATDLTLFLEDFGRSQ